MEKNKVKKITTQEAAYYLKVKAWAFNIFLKKHSKVCEKGMIDLNSLKKEIEKESLGRK